MFAKQVSAGKRAFPKVNDIRSLHIVRVAIRMQSIEKILNSSQFAETISHTKQDQIEITPFELAISIASSYFFKKLSFAPKSLSDPRSLPGLANLGDNAPNIRKMPLIMSGCCQYAPCFLHR